MSEGILFYFDRETELDSKKVDIKEALYKSRHLLSKTSGLSMKELNERPFLKYFKRRYKSSLNVNRKKSSDIKKKRVRNTFVGKRK